MGLPSVNVYSNLYVTPSIHVKRKRKKKKKPCVKRKKSQWRLIYLNNQIDISYNSPSHAHVEFFLTIDVGFFFYNPKKKKKKKVTVYDYEEEKK